MLISPNESRVIFTERVSSYFHQSVNKQVTKNYDAHILIGKILLKSFKGKIQISYLHYHFYTYWRQL